MTKPLQIISHSFTWNLGEIDGIPDVPFAEGVDRVKLTQGDPNPKFLVLPFAQDGLVSEGWSPIRYDRQFNEGLMKAINTRKVGGDVGHVFFGGGKDDVSPTIWVGAMRDEDGIYWGKNYLTNEKVRRYFEVKEAVGAPIGTSIFGWAKPDGVETDDDGIATIAADSFILKSLDLLEDNAFSALEMDRPYRLMTHDLLRNRNNKEEENDMTVTLDQVPAEVRQAIIDEYVSSAENETALANVREELETAQNRVTELEQENVGLGKEVFRHSLNDMVAEAIDLELEGDMYKVLHSFVRNSVLAELSGLTDKDKAQEVVQSVITSDEYKALAKSIVTKAAGGGTFGGSREGYEDDKTPGELYEENIDDLADEWGMGSE